MKTTNKLLFNLLLLCLFSCDQAGSDLKEATTGTLILKAEQAPLELVEVTNARQSETKDNKRVAIYIYTEDHFQYAYSEDIGETYTLDMEPGWYQVFMTSYDESHALADGFAEFEIKAGQETDVTVTLKLNYIEVQPILVNMDNSAKLWLGDKGFVTADKNHITYSDSENGPSHRHYPNTTTVDLVLEYNGKTKRFNMAVQKGKKYIVEIVHDSEGDGDGNGDGEEKTGSVSVGYTYEELTVERIKFKF